MVPSVVPSPSRERWKVLPFTAETSGPDRTNLLGVRGEGDARTLTTLAESTADASKDRRAETLLSTNLEPSDTDNRL